jgi:phage terminase small subunit
MTTKVTPTRPLTPNQERFIIEYAKDFNASAAARRAGYKGKYIDRLAHQLLVRTRDLMKERGLMRHAGTGIATLEQTLKLVSAMAFFDPGKMYDDHGNCKEIPTLPKVQRLAVAGFKVSEEFTGRGDARECTGYLKEFKLTDRAVWAHMLMKHLGGYPTKQELAVPPAQPGGIDWNSLPSEERAALRQQIATAVAKAVVAQPLTGNGHVNGHGT